MLSDFSATSVTTFTSIIAATMAIVAIASVNMASISIDSISLLYDLLFISSTHAILLLLLYLLLSIYSDWLLVVMFFTHMYACGYAGDQKKHKNQTECHEIRDHQLFIASHLVEYLNVNLLFLRENEAIINHVIVHALCELRFNEPFR